MGKTPFTYGFVNGFLWLVFNLLCLSATLMAKLLSVDYKLGVEAVMKVEIIRYLGFEVSLIK